MNENKKLRASIESIIKKLMENVMRKVLIDDPFVVDLHRVKKPLYAALVPDEIFKGSHFERRFVTPFGKVWEQLAVAASKAISKQTHQGYKIDGLIMSGRLKRITSIINQLEHPTLNNKGEKIRPNWEKELNYILKGKGSLVPISVICDIYIENDNGKFAFELKAPLPDSDQTKVSKEKLFKLYAMENSPITDAFFALPYNPYGERRDYSWSFPARWFDMKTDKSVMIGNEFWDFIGGAGTYQLFIDEINKLGAEYKIKIYKEFLGINVPESVNDYKMQ